MTPGISGRLPWVFTAPALELLVTGARQGPLQGSALDAFLYPSYIPPIPLLYLSYTNLFGVASLASRSGDVL